MFSTGEPRAAAKTPSLGVRALQCNGAMIRNAKLKAKLSRVKMCVSQEAPAPPATASAAAGGTPSQLA